jgi:TatA/E family protein of Tat protein translocase
MKKGLVFQVGSRPLEFSAFDPKRHSRLAMLSLPHLVVLFVIALIIFGPQKLPELARMLGKATAEFRKMTNDFRYALEDEVRELERQTRIREEEAAAAARAAQASAPAPAPALAPEGAVPRETPGAIASGPAEPQTETQPTSESGVNPGHHTDSGSSQPTQTETVSVPREKSSDDNTAV